MAVEAEVVPEPEEPEETLETSEDEYEAEQPAQSSSVFGRWFADRQGFFRG